VVTTVMSGRDVCCIYLVSWKSGTVTLVSRNLTQKTATRLQCNNPLPFSPPAAPRDRVVKQADASVGSEARGHRRQLNNAGKLHQEQSRNLQARARLHLLSGATTHVYCVLPQITRTRTLRLRRRVYRRQGVGPDRNTRGGGSARCHQPTRKRVVPFCSSKVGAIGLFVEHEMRTASVRVLPSCWMTVSVPALLSVSQQPGSCHAHHSLGRLGPGCHARPFQHPRGEAAETGGALLDHGLLAVRDTRL
jgi:hypothetical protein